MIKTITKIIYPFCNKFKAKFCPNIMSQMNLFPICEINNQKYFFAKEYNEIYAQEVDGELVVIYNEFETIYEYPITSYIIEALLLNATDMHMTNNNIIYKSQKKFLQKQIMHQENFTEIFNYLKIFCGLNFVEKKDESGVLYVNFIGKIIGVRVSFFEGVNTLLGNKNTLISFRFLYTYTNTLKDKIATNPELSWLIENITKPGLLVIAGQTGVGKTTFMYDFLDLLQDKNINIMTAEDPVERIVDGILQREIEDNYEYVIKSILRHNPDVIVIGEIRDKIAAAICIRAVLTGHSVICTLHLDVSDIINNFFHRFQELGVEKKYLDNAIKAYVTLGFNYTFNILKKI